MPRILAIANQKGGVGKTTTAVNLAASLAVAERRVLLVDVDPQGNATTAFGVDKSNLSAHAYHALLGQAPLAEAIRSTELPGLHLVPANTDLVGAEVELVSAVGRELRLSDTLEACLDPSHPNAAGPYDDVVIDCPPSLGLLTVNALTAADETLIPLQTEFYALEGLSHLLGTIDLVRDRLNARLNLGGILLTMFDRRNRLSHQVYEEVRQHFPKLLLQTRIPRNVRLSESPSFGRPAVLYDVAAAGTRAYLDLAAELLDRSAPQDDGSAHTPTADSTAGA